MALPKAKQTKATLKKERRDWRTPFLAALASSPSVQAAAQAAMVSRQYVYSVRAEDPEFAAAWDDAINQSLDAAEAELYRRAVIGVDKPITVARRREIITEHSDTLLIFLLKSHRRSVYGDTSRSLNLNLTPEQLAGMSDDDLDKLINSLSRK